MTDKQWFDDPDEVLAFAHWYFDSGTVLVREILYFFEKPWKWTPQYEEWKAGEGGV